MPTSEELRANPPSITEISARQPLGPPQGFFAGQTAFQGAEVDPEFQAKGPYVTGDEWVPAFAFTPDDRDRLKARMNAAGLYGEGGYQSGTWTPNDANAYKIVLESANGMGRRDANIVIDNLAASARTAGARVQGPRAPLVSKISNPDDIRAVIRQVSFDLTGSRLSDEDEARLIAMYQGQESAENMAVGAGQQAAPGSVSTVTGAAGMQSFAESQVERMRPGEVATHRHLDAFEAIMQSMGTMVPVEPTYSGEGLPKAGGEVL